MATLYNHNFPIYRCKQCVFPNTVPGITFNDEGVCNFCLSYKKETYLGENAFEKIISSIKKGVNPYDCIVPLSGGRDSSFVLYAAKKLYDLNVLAVNYDNEFQTTLALQNIENACTKLNVECIKVKSKNNIAQKIVRYSISSASSLNHQMGICFACEYGYRSTVFRTAQQYGVPLILWGESPLEATKDMENQVFSKLLHKKNQSLLKFSKLLHLNFYLREYNKLLQRLEFHVPGNNFFSRGYPILRSKEIKEIKFFNYIEWNREKIKKTIMNDLDWEKPSYQLSTWRLDCTLHQLITYIYFKLIGCSKECFGYCKMINSGQMNRKDALKQEEEQAAKYSDNINFLLEDKIGLSKKEMLTFFNLQ